LSAATRIANGADPFEFVQSGIDTVRIVQVAPPVQQCLKAMVCITGRYATQDPIFSGPTAINSRDSKPAAFVTPVAPLIATTGGAPGHEHDNGRESQMMTNDRRAR
jgi:hypothetical protein